MGVEEGGGEEAGVDDDDVRNRRLRGAITRFGGV